MTAHQTSSAPERLSVVEIVRSRYIDNKRPASWDDRIAGVDVVRVSDGRTVKLVSDGMQSPPQRGWVIELTGGDSESGYRWTLYGLPPQSEL